MRGEIICIGDELMSGRVADTNSRYALKRLWPLGIEVGAVVLVGDDPQAIRDSLGRALKRADFVLVTGGLGTTDDDITARTAAEVFELPLAESQRMVKNLRAFLAARGREPSEEVLRMAWLPQGAEILCSRSFIGSSCLTRWWPSWTRTTPKALASCPCWRARRWSRADRPPTSARTTPARPRSPNPANWNWSWTGSRDGDEERAD